MPSLREAAQQALEALESAHGTVTETDWKIDYSKEIAALRAALEQEEPFSPEAVRTTQTAWKMGYEAAKAEQESEQKPMHPEMKKLWSDYFDKCFRRQPLTEVEIIGKTCECIDDGTFEMACAIDFARAIERAHGIGGSE